MDTPEAVEKYIYLLLLKLSPRIASPGTHRSLKIMSLPIGTSSVDTKPMSTRDVQSAAFFGVTTLRHAIPVFHSSDLPTYRFTVLATSAIAMARKGANKENTSVPTVPWAANEAEPTSCHVYKFLSRFL